MRYIGRCQKGLWFIREKEEFFKSKSISNLGKPSACDEFAKESYAHGYLSLQNSTWIEQGNEVRLFVCQVLWDYLLFKLFLISLRSFSRDRIITGVLSALLLLALFSTSP